MLKKHLMAAVLGGILMTGLGGLAATPAAAQGPCLSPADARAVVQSGQAVSLSQIRPQLTAQMGGEVVSAQLCIMGGRYVYVVNVLTRTGAVKTLTVDAANGVIYGGAGY